VVDEVLAVDLDTVQRAREIVLARAELTARDAVHVAVMQVHRIPEILSFDRHFDGVPGVARLG
jgi:predicted nucleic acid-binding protein